MCHLYLHVSCTCKSAYALMIACRYMHVIHIFSHPDESEMEEITSVMFNGAISASKGLWLFNQNVQLSSDDCMDGECGFFNSSAQSKLELAYFSNAFDRFESFSVRLFFKRSAGVSGVRSLLDNSECSIDGSVVAQSDASAAVGYFANSTGSQASFDFAVSRTNALAKILNTLSKVYVLKVLEYCV